MTEAIQAVAAEAVKATQTTAPAAQPQAGAFEVHQFSDAYARNNAAAASEAQKSAGVNATQGPSESMRAIAAFANNINSGAGDIGQLAEKMSSADFASRPSAMIEMTVACQQFMFKAELTSNVANRTSDGIQQLFRQQS
ncbi:hypothetical protein [Luteimonas aquatica]|uniref:hypothetical protein n=1 Tax=Luteimonas aquatica TaxID=450364 RepID=UPI001F5AF877|nr:hypothetical protein [Luteimonas aquatica]